jgi:hypothetical protein
MSAEYHTELKTNDRKFGSCGKVSKYTIILKMIQRTIWTCSTFRMTATTGE